MENTPPQDPDQSRRPETIGELIVPALDKIEQSLATRFDVSTVLDIVRRPILLRSRVVPLVKQGVEGVEHECFVFLL